MLFFNSYSFEFCIFEKIIYCNLIRDNMDNKIQELTDKIYHEGVEKGNDEAKKIISAAKIEADKIINDAKNQAQEIISAAKKSSDEYADNTKSEIKLFSKQAVDALKSEITTLLTNNVVDDAIKGFVNDKDYLNKFILTLAQKWSATEPIVISSSNADELKKYFIANAKELLDKGVEINQVNNIKTLFTISPADGSYKINFGEDEFVSYFKEFLRPQLVEILF